MLRRMNAVQGLGLSRRREIRFEPRRGQPLPEELRERAEALFGEDLSDVRIFVGPEAERLGARAFTSGSRIYLAPQEYAPGTERWVQLLGHELAHVVQQRRGRVRNPHGYGVAVVSDPHLEAEADRMGRALQKMDAQRTIWQTIGNFFSGDGQVNAYKCVSAYHLKGGWEGC